MGPIWDFNLGFGNVDYCTNGNPEGFVIDFNTICPQDYWLIPFWWDRLFEDQVFREKVVARWEALRADAFATSEIHSYIDSVASVLNESQQRNFQKWPVLGEYVWPNYYVGNTYQQEIDWLKAWITARMNWLDLAIQGIVTSADEEVRRANLKIYPNPFVSDLTFEYTLKKSGDVNVEMFDMMGKKVTGFEFTNQHPGTYNPTFNLQGIPAGVYFYRYRSGGDRTLTGKLIKE